MKMKIVEYKAKFDIVVSYDVFVNETVIYTSRPEESIAQIRSHIECIYLTLSVVGKVEIENETIEVGQ